METGFSQTGLNLVILQGRPTVDPEIKDTTSGRIMCKTRLAVNRPYLGENAPQRTDFFDVIGFGEIGRNMHNNLGKGAFCTVIGRVEQSEFINRNGVKQEKYSVVANRIIIHEWNKSRASRELDELNEEFDVPREIRASLEKAVSNTDIDLPY